MDNRQVVFVEQIIKDEEFKAGQDPKFRPHELLERGLEARRTDGWCDTFSVPLPTPQGEKWAIVFHRHHHKI